MNLMSVLHSASVCLVIFWLCAMSPVLGDQATSNDTSKPANYNEIKALLNSYASAIDNYGEVPDGRTALLAKGDEATLALIELLKEKINTPSFPQEKSAIVSILEHDRASDKKKSAMLLEGVLPKKVQEWNGQWWIVETIRFLTQADPEIAQRVARKAMNGSMSEVKYAAIKTLGVVGNLEDIRSIELFRASWRTSMEKSGHPQDKEADYVDDNAVQSEAQIYKRILPDI